MCIRDRLAGREQPSATPEAELWVGAHEAGPARVDLGDGHFCGLDEHIAGDDERHLGTGSLDAFGRRLPFLLKILAADRALSIQAHPDAARAASAPARTPGRSSSPDNGWDEEGTEREIMGTSLGTPLAGMAS